MQQTSTPCGGLSGAITPIIVLLLLLVSTRVSADPLQIISFRDKFFDLAMRGDELFAVGYPGWLLRSRDRGASFEVVDVGTKDALFAVDMASDGTGAVVGRSGLLLTTSDGGKSWTKRDTGIKEHLFDVSVIPGGHIWAVGHFGSIAHSSDGGKSFTVQNYDATLPAAPGEPAAAEQTAKFAAEADNEGSVEEARLNGVTFVDAQKGWITGEFGLVLHTEDGGATWKRQRSNVGKLMFGIHAVDDKRVMAVGAEGTFIETSDGGANWTQAQTGASEHLLGLWPVGGKCFVVGGDGLVMVRENPTGSFKRLATGIFSWLGSVVFRDANLGFVAGGRGYLLQTTDGGATWRRLSGK